MKIGFFNKTSPASDSEVLVRFTKKELALLLSSFNTEDPLAKELYDNIVSQIVDFNACNKDPV